MSKPDLIEPAQSKRVQVENAPIAPFQLYRLPEVARLVGVSNRTIERWMITENFPKPYKIGPSAIRWRRDEIHHWINSRPKKSQKNSMNFAI